MRDAERSTQRAVQTMYADSVPSPCNHNRYAAFQKGCRGTRGAAPYRSCLGAVHRSRLTAVGWLQMSPPGLKPGEGLSCKLNV